MPIDPNRDRRSRKSATLTREDAEALALRAVAWLAGNEDLFLRFVSLSGMSVDHVRAGLTDPGMLGAVLDFMLSDEPTLLAFVTAHDLAPDLPGRARRLLPGGPIEG
jgi:hypothetical protein